MKPVIIGVAGGSGSGKTTVVKHIMEHVGEERIQLIEHDSYYRDLRHISFEERFKVNFDHPSSLETELMIRHVKALCEGYSVDIPVYNYQEHIREELKQTVSPKPIILLDGILILSEPELRELMDFRIYVDTDDDIRLLRRLQRDIQERGRSVESVMHQYEKFVRPMHLKFVEPSKRYADIIIPRGGRNKTGLEMILALIRNKIAE